MTDTIEGLSKEITALKEALITGTIAVDQKKPDNKVSELKQHLIEQAPKLITEEWFKTQFNAEYFKKIEEMHQELVKAKKSEWMEAMGLEGFASAVEKFHEDSVWWPAYALSAFIGLAVPAFLLALALNFKNLQRTIQGGIFNFLGRKWPQLRNQILAQRDGGLIPRRQDRDDVRRNEEASAGGMAAIPRNANFDNLRAQLERLNPELLTFNNRAPDFISGMRKLPSASKAGKAAEAIKKIADAITGVDHRSMPLVASGMGKINGAVRNADPKKTTKFADAIGKLKIAMTGLDVDKVPKAGTLGQAAEKAALLAENTGTLAAKMRDFARTVRDINAELGGGAPA
ncbi:hypothetical protein ACIO8G_25495 [Streptomyces sp. NPDC087219]|uniref:hypothetical protein n=1 Tax=Streptomyces sp. NPDC087219 TaxID=3365770 RepID=UPI0037FF7DE9